MQDIHVELTGQEEDTSLVNAPDKICSTAAGSAQGLSFEEYLSRYGTLTYITVGVSMLPMLRQQRDLVNIRKKGAERCRKYDVVLYHGPANKHILHRVVQVREHDYVILGDNCIQKEYGITDSQIIGVLESFVRDGRLIRTDSPMYLVYSRLWVFLSPVRILSKRFLRKSRSIIRRLKHFLKRLLK